MSETRYVQHVSGQGNKFRVTEYCGVHWEVQQHADPSLHHYLPVSEYVPCAPPERWVDVTAECQVNDQEPGRAGLTHFAGNFNRVATIDFGYRLRKVRALIEGGQVGSGEMRTAFVVEQREP